MDAPEDKEKEEVGVSAPLAELRRWLTGEQSVAQGGFLCSCLYIVCWGVDLFFGLMELWCG